MCLWLNYVLSLEVHRVRNKIKLITKLITTTTQSCSMYVLSSCMYHNNIIHSKVNVYYLVPTCALHIKILRIKFINLKTSSMPHIELLACVEQNLRHNAVVMLVAYWVSNHATKVVSSWKLYLHNIIIIGDSISTLIGVSSSDKNLGWKRDKWVGVFSMPSSLGCIFRRISLIPPECFG